MLLSGVRKIRPSLYHIDVLITESEEQDLKRYTKTSPTNWKWVDVKELAEIAGVPLRNLLLEFADYKFRGSKYTGICFVRENEVCGTRGWRIIRHNYHHPDKEKYFFWRTADLAYPYGDWMSPQPAVDIICSWPVFVPSGWANGVLDEIERRREAGKPVLQTVHE